MGGPDSFGAMSSSYEALLLLGGNMGEMKETFAVVEARIEQQVGRILSHSRDHWTEPWGFSDERLFLNRALIVETRSAPEEIMRVLLRIEEELGRTREQDRYAARAIDIDILLIGNLVIDTPSLSVPHPRMHERAFALSPAADIAPGWVHPVLGRNVLEMLGDLRRPA